MFDLLLLSRLRRLEDAVKNGGGGSSGASPYVVDLSAYGLVMDFDDMQNAVISKDDANAIYEAMAAGNCAVKGFSETAQTNVTATPRTVSWLSDGEYKQAMAVIERAAADMMTIEKAYLIIGDTPDGCSIAVSAKF